MKKAMIILFVILYAAFVLVGCTSNVDTNEVTITVAAAASLKNVMDDELIPIFEKQYPDIDIQNTYDSSGKLQSQIEAGADIDIFMSAAMKQMTELDEKDLMDQGSIVELLENKVVLIVPQNSMQDIDTFEDIVKADQIAIGDPESVPAGQYAKEVLTNLQIWDKAVKKFSLATNVTEVLNWVVAGSADVGIVYSTDAVSNDQVKVVAEAPEESVSKVTYPVGIVEDSNNKESAQKFIEFLKSNEAQEIFQSYDFSVNE